MLEGGKSETTNHAFIIRNSNDINLYEASLIKNKFDFYFQKGAKLASQKDNVTSKIREINHNVKNFSYYILETPIQIFKDIDLKQDLLNKIEIIDYPGLNSKKAKKGKYTDNNLLELIDGFFFLNEPITKGSNDIKEVFKEIIERFIYQDSNVDDLKNSLFLFVKNNDDEQNDFYDLDIEKEFIDLFENFKKPLEWVDIHRIESKLNYSTIKFAKFSNIDYKKYIEMDDILGSFKTFISYIIKIKIKKINKSNLKSIFDFIDSFIKEKYDDNIIKTKQNIIQRIIKFFWINNNDKKKDKVDISIEEDIFIEWFKEILIEFKLINVNYKFLNKEKRKILEYAKEYLLLKSNLKNHIFYQNSFYDSFKEKFGEIMNYSDVKINKKLNEYLNNIVSKTKVVMDTIFNMFNLNQTEFEIKYSEKERKKNNDYNENNFETIKILVNKEIIEMKSLIEKKINNLNCGTNDPDKFRYEFLRIKQEITNIIENKSERIQEFYNNFRQLISKLINVYKSDQFESLKDKINMMKGIKINQYFSNVNFSTYGWFTHAIINFFGYLFGYQHKYEDDIRNTCNEYKVMINHGYDEIEKNLVEKFKDLRDKGIEIINLIFSTANSDFEELKKNKNKCIEIFKLVNNILRNNTYDN